MKKLTLIRLPVFNINKKISVSHCRPLCLNSDLCGGEEAAAYVSPCFPGVVLWSEEVCYSLQESCAGSGLWPICSPACVPSVTTGA